MTATWNRDGGRFSAVDGMTIETLRQGTDWLGVVNGGREAIERVAVRETEPEAWAAAVALALDVLDEMRRAVEGLR